MANMRVPATNANTVSLIVLNVVLVLTTALFVQELASQKSILKDPHAWMCAQTGNMERIVQISHQLRIFATPALRDALPALLLA